MIDLGRLIRWAIVLFLIFYIVTDPAKAGAQVHGIIDGAHSVLTSLATFVNSL